MPCALIGGGNHQVLAAKKYAMIAVSIQTTGASSIDSTPLRGPSSLYCIRTWNEIITLDQVRATPVTDSGYRFTKIPANRGAAFQAAMPPFRRACFLRVKMRCRPGGRPTFAQSLSRSELAGGW